LAPPLPFPARREPASVPTLKSVGKALDNLQGHSFHGALDTLIGPHRRAGQLGG